MGRVNVEGVVVENVKAFGGKDQKGLPVCAKAKWAVSNRQQAVSSFLKFVSSIVFNFKLSI